MLFDFLELEQLEIFSAEQDFLVFEKATDIKYIVLARAAVTQIALSVFCFHRFLLLLSFFICWRSNGALKVMAQTRRQGSPWAVLFVHSFHFVSVSFYADFHEEKRKWNFQSCLSFTEREDASPDGLEMFLSFYLQQSATQRENSRNAGKPVAGIWVCRSVRGGAQQTADLLFSSCFGRKRAPLSLIYPVPPS